MRGISRVAATLDTAGPPSVRPIDPYLAFDSLTPGVPWITMPRK